MVKCPYCEEEVEKLIDITHKKVVFTGSRFMWYDEVCEDCYKKIRVD